MRTVEKLDKVAVLIFPVDGTCTVSMGHWRAVSLWITAQDREVRWVFIGRHKGELAILEGWRRGR